MAYGFRPMGFEDIQKFGRRALELEEVLQEREGFERQLRQKIDRESLERARELARGFGVTKLDPTVFSTSGFARGSGVTGRGLRLDPYGEEGRAIAALNELTKPSVGAKRFPRLRRRRQGFDPYEEE